MVSVGTLWRKCAVRKRQKGTFYNYDDESWVAVVVADGISSLKMKKKFYLKKIWKSILEKLLKSENHHLSHTTYKIQSYNNHKFCKIKFTKSHMSKRKMSKMTF